MNALGGRGIWFSGFFLEWVERRGAGSSSEGGNRRNSPGGASTNGGRSENVMGVMFAVNAIPPPFDGLTGIVQTSWLPGKAASEYFPFPSVYIFSDLTICLGSPRSSCPFSGHYHYIRCAELDLCSMEDGGGR